jgi:hypothetical protein
MPPNSLAELVPIVIIPILGVPEGDDSYLNGCADSMLTLV